MWRRFFSSESKSVTSAAALLGVASLLSRFVGVLRDRLLSGAFGAGPELDAYYAAFRAPDFIYNLFVLGAITAGFIPVMSAYMAKSDDKMDAESRELASALLTMLGAGLVVLAVVGLLVAPIFVPLLTPGFSAAQQAVTVQLTRIMFLSPVFLGLSAVLGGLLQVRRRFFIYALAPILYNIGIIGGTVLLVPTMGIAGVAIGVTAGAFLHYFVQFWACRGLGFRFRFTWKPQHEGVRKIAKMMVPRTASLAVSQVNLVILTGMASSLGAGSIAVFNLANNLQSFPVGIIGVSFAVAAFPLIAELAARKKHADFADALSKTVRSILFLVLPATVALLLLRAQIVRVLLGTGNFDWNDTIQTADTLSFFTLSLFAQALLPLVARAFFAIHDVTTPLVAAIASVVIERLLAVVLISQGMGVAGLALAYSAGSIVNIIMLWLFLRLRMGELREKAILKSLALTSIASVLMAVAIQGMKVMVGPMVDMTRFVGIFTQGLSAGLVGIGVYVGAAYLMGSEEAQYVVGLYRRKVSPTRPMEVTQEEETLNVE